MRLPAPYSRENISKWAFQPSGFGRGAKCCMGAPRSNGFLFAPLSVGRLGEREQMWNFIHHDDTNHPGLSLCACQVTRPSHLCRFRATESSRNPPASRCSASTTRPSRHSRLPRSSLRRLASRALFSSPHSRSPPLDFPTRGGRRTLRHSRGAPATTTWRDASTSIAPRYTAVAGTASMLTSLHTLARTLLPPARSCPRRGASQRHMQRHTGIINS